jgi:hypothetical protein
VASLGGNMLSGLTSLLGKVQSSIYNYTPLTLPTFAKLNMGGPLLLLATFTVGLLLEIAGAGCSQRCFSWPGRP